MNTSLSVELCEDAGLDVEFIKDLTRVTDSDGIPIAEIFEAIDSRYWIDTSALPHSVIKSVASAVTDYALTLIKDRE